MATSPRVRPATNTITPHHVNGRLCRNGVDMAALRQQLELSMRPRDKELPWFDPYDELFEQYVKTDLLDLSSDNTGEASSSDDLSSLLQVPSSSSGSVPKVEPSPMPNWESRHSESDDTWQQAWRYQPQNAASTNPGNQTSIYPESRGKAAASDPGLFSFEEPCPQVPSDPFLLTHPASPYPNPVPSPTKKFHSLPIRGRKANPAAIRKVSSKGSLQAKMMRPSAYRSGYQDIWAKRIGAAPLSPPPSAKVSQEEAQYGYAYSNNMMYPMPREGIDMDNDLPLTSQAYPARSHVQMTPLASPTEPSSARSSFHQMNDATTAAYVTNQLNDLQTPPQSARVPSSDWTQHSNAAFDFGLAASSDLDNGKEPQPWWSTNNEPQPCQQSAYHHNRFDSLAISTAPSDLASNGLMIQCEPSPFNSMLDAHAPGSSTPPLMYSAQMYGNAPVLQPAHPYPQAQVQAHRITPPSRSPSSTPPLNIHSPRTRHSSSRPQSQHRRKSSSAATGSTPRPAPVGFVNYTPDDSRKILTGVAPSGSSKTKARREKEAAEKRRRLSQAAARAIIEAGGDLQALEREGLLILPEA
ncbi:hypothetical protein K490DRAFT_61321 [Saccharata proteae CBS 121410]|uniref:Developmental regulatory protein wetA n=1 Tax=Saccharata proteae CBS 121410 TaxID=1314787 RepID=A0A9P4M3I0_9PEZI|nr:hypothetical protein K490DRAFT_61321 [Saccharata proteae CBS 121410]